MARTVRNPKLDTRSARAKLPAHREPYWLALAPGRHLGYRRLGAEGGTWIARAYDPATRKKAHRALGAADDALDANGETVLTMAEAQEKARAWFPLAFRPEGEGPAPDQPKVETVGEAVEEYLGRLAAERKPELAKGARYTAEAHILPKLGPIRLTALTEVQVRAWHRAVASAPARVRTRKGAPVQQTKAVAVGYDARRQRQATANRVLAVLKAALNHALRERHIRSDDAWRHAKPFPKVNAARVSYLTVAEIARLLNACSPDLRRLARGAVFTGARYGELTRLEIGDFSADSGTLHVRQSKAGKARHIPLDDEGLLFFRSITAGRPKGERIFLRADGRPWGASHQLRPVALACKAAGLTDVSFHTLRHTYASLRVMAGGPLMAIAQVLGHTDTRMVEKHYGHLAPSFVRDMVRGTALGIGAGEEAEKVTPLRVGVR